MYAAMVLSQVDKYDSPNWSVVADRLADTCVHQWVPARGALESRLVHNMEASFHHIVYDLVVWRARNRASEGVLGV